MADEKTIALNRRARHEFTIDDTFEAGLVLTGTEIKSIRAVTAAERRRSPVRPSPPGACTLEIDPVRFPGTKGGDVQ